MVSWQDTVLYWNSELNTAIFWISTKRTGQIIKSYIKQIRLNRTIHLIILVFDQSESKSTMGKKYGQFTWDEKKARYSSNTKWAAEAVQSKKFF